MTEHSFARRDVIKAAGAGLATSLAGRRDRAGPDARRRPDRGEFWTAEYTAKKGDVSLAMYRKRVGAPAPASREAGAVPGPRLVQWRAVEL